MHAPVMLRKIGVVVTLGFSDECERSTSMVHADCVAGFSIEQVMSGERTSLKPELHSGHESGVGPAPAPLSQQHGSPGTHVKLPSRSSAALSGCGFAKVKAKQLGSAQHSAWVTVFGDEQGLCQQHTWQSCTVAFAASTAFS